MTHYQQQRATAMKRASPPGSALLAFVLAIACIALLMRGSDPQNECVCADGSTGASAGAGAGGRAAGGGGGSAQSREAEATLQRFRNVEGKRIDEYSPKARPSGVCVAVCAFRVWLAV